MIFKAEIKKVGVTKTASNDMEVQLLLITDNVEVLELGKIPSDKIVDVIIKQEN